MAVPPKGITDRPLDEGNIVGLNWSTDPNTMGRKVQAIWNFLERELRPAFQVLWRKVVGMLNTPGEMSNPFFDGTTWRSVRLGVLAPDLTDANETLTVAMGDVHLQRKGSLTAPRVKTLSLVGAADGNVKVLYNLSSFSVTFGATVVASGYYGKLRFNGAAWAEPEVLKIVADPEF